VNRSLIAISLLICLGTVVCRAQEESDYQQWMKDVDSSHKTLREDLKTESGSAASADAAKLAAIFDQVGQFWQKRNAGDAVMFASDAASGFKRVATLSSAGKFSEASTVLKSVESNCSSCHRAHRGVSLHGWKIK
jgi:cytochrome c556